MKYVFILFIAVLLTPNLQAQKKKFLQKDDFIKVYKGDHIDIHADTAFVVSANRAGFINNKLEELDEVKNLYNDAAEQNNGLLNSLTELETIVEKLNKRMESNKVEVKGKLQSLLAEMDLTLEDLHKNNDLLTKNNKSLQDKIQNLEVIIKKLRKETKGLWWNGLTDKLIAVAGGIGIGLLVSVL